MRIAGVASAFPRQYYQQEIITGALERHWADSLENSKVLERLMARAGVEARYLALPIEGYNDLTTWGKSNNAWIEVAEELAEQAICRALTRAGLSEADPRRHLFRIGYRHRESIDRRPPDQPHEPSP